MTENPLSDPIDPLDDSRDSTDRVAEITEEWEARPSDEPLRPGDTSEASGPEGPAEVRAERDAQRPDF